MSMLYIIGTPIGNLEDITLRALRILKEVDVVFAEDTRQAKKLLGHFEIQKPIERYDEHSHDVQVRKVIEALEEGKDIAYVSDAGTPGISDPGRRLVELVNETFPEIYISPIPGPSALTTALSASGLIADEFVFLGFLPHKKGRQTLFKEIADSKRTTAFYESPHRIEKTLQSLEEHLSIDRRIVVARELTKIHEEFIDGTPVDVRLYFKNNPDKVRGEFVVLVSGNEK